MKNHQQSLTCYAKSFISELANQSVTDVVISPGSRSTPLAMLMAENKHLNIHIHVDERSAAFFALGIAKATNKPTAILCTSGTAAANYYPAIIEAKLSRVPLLVLTADRPHELRDVGAPQAIDQIDLFGKHVKHFFEMPLPENNDQTIKYVQSTCSRAVAISLCTPMGPVHLNFPLREPLIPSFDCVPENRPVTRQREYVNVSQGILTLSQDDFKNIAEDLNSFNSGLIVCGPCENNHYKNEVVSLAKKLKFPVIADPLSQLRSGSHDNNLIITSYDSFLKDDNVKETLQPDVIIRFGAMPVSKALTQYIDKYENVQQYVIDGGAMWRDPVLNSTEMVYCDEHKFCTNISQKLNEKNELTWLKRWLEIENITKNELSLIKNNKHLSESKLFAILPQLLPKESTLFVGNSMPIRDVDTFFHFNKNNIKIMANRGANGIDGITSTALGVALKKQNVFLVVGDLTFFHDLNGLLAAKLLEINLTIIVINNNGGGIFSFLPQANYDTHFEKLFGTPLNLDFSHAVKMYDGQYFNIKDWDDFYEKFSQAKKSPQLNVIEISTNRDENLQEHRQLWKNVAREINSYLEVK